MESEERPNKMRKLSHSLEEDPPSSQAKQDAPAHDNEQDEVHQEQAHLDAELGSTTTADTPIQNDDAVSASVQPITSDPSPSTSQPLSKNQLKKLRKAQEWAAGKDSRKAKRRDKMKEKRQRHREQREQEAEDRKAHGEPEQRSKPQPNRHVRLPVTFLIDCGFDDKMTEKERISLASQLTRSYSDNHKAPYQAHLVISSWGGHLKERFDTVLNGHHLNWKGVQFMEEDFVDASVKAQECMGGPRGGVMAGVFQQYANNKRNGQRHQQQQPGKSDEDTTTTSNTQPPVDPVPEPEPKTQPSTTTDDMGTNTNTNTTNTTTAQTQPTPLPSPETIYLSSESPHTLTTLSPNSTYIIGGLVDHNRHKGICYRSATDRGVKTAKLPIGEFMEMQSRYVLATNHVVEIMVRWLECGDWGEAFMKVIPKRKGGRLRDGASSVDRDEEGVDDGDMEEKRSGSEDEDEDDAQDGDGDGDVVLNDAKPEAGNGHQATADTAEKSVGEIS